MTNEGVPESPGPKPVGSRPGDRSVEEDRRRLTPSPTQWPPWGLLPSPPPSSTKAAVAPEASPPPIDWDLPEDELKAQLGISDSRTAFDFEAFGGYQCDDAASAHRLVPDHPEPEGTSITSQPDGAVADSNPHPPARSESDADANESDADANESDADANESDSHPPARFEFDVSANGSEPPSPARSEFDVSANSSEPPSPARSAADDYAHSDDGDPTSDYEDEPHGLDKFGEEKYYDSDVDSDWSGGDNNAAAVTSTRVTRGMQRELEARKKALEAKNKALEAGRKDFEGQEQPLGAGKIAPHAEKRAIEAEAGGAKRGILSAYSTWPTTVPPTITTAANQLRNSQHVQKRRKMKRARDEDGEADLPAQKRREHPGA